MFDDGVAVAHDRVIEDDYPRRFGRRVSSAPRTLGGVLRGDGDQADDIYDPEDELAENLQSLVRKPVNRA